MLNATNIAPILLSAEDAARALGIGRTLFLQLDREGKIPMGHNLGKRKLWSRKELEAWADAGMPTRQNWLEISRAS